MMTARDPLDFSPGASRGRPCARMCPVSEPEFSRAAVPAGPVNAGWSWPGVPPPYTVPGGRCWRAHSPYCAEGAGGLTGGQRGSCGTAPFSTIPAPACGGIGRSGGGAAGAMTGGGAGRTAAPVRGWYPVATGDVGGGHIGSAEAGTTTPFAFADRSIDGGPGTGGGGGGLGGTGGCGGIGCGGTGGTGPGGPGGTGPGG